MNVKRIALALALSAALLTLSGCDGVQDGTIDYIDGHWVFTSAQTEQQTDITQLLASPDAFYAAASAMSDGELQRCFDLLSSGQCAELFRTLGEERAMALAGRLTQPQVERLLSALQGQERVQSLSDPAALAAVWPTLTTDEQLLALSGLSSGEYAALRALLDAAATTPEPEPVQPETTDAPDMTDPVYLAGIWHKLSHQEQSDVLSRLSSAQFVALWGLLDAQGNAANEKQTAERAKVAALSPAAADAASEQTSVPQTSVPQTPEPQESAPAQEASTAPDGEEDAGMKEPEALADAWYTLSPEEQLSAVTALTADQFVSLQELLSVKPKPTPAEEDELFIPTPRPTARRTPRPTPTPTAPPDDAAAGTTEPDLTDPAVLSGIWHTLSPQEQLSILSTLTVEQYTELQEKLAQLSDSEGDVPNHEEPAAEEKPAEKPDDPNEESGDGSTPEEEPPAEKPHNPDEMAGDGSTSGEETPAEQPDESDGANDDASTPEEEAPAEKPDESDGTDSDPSAPAEEISEEESEASAPIDLDYLANIWHTLSPSEQLSILSTLSIDQYHALQELLVRRLNGGEDVPKDAEQNGETTPAEEQDEPDETNSDVSEPKEETLEEHPDKSSETTNDASTPEKKASDEQSAVSDEESTDLSGMDDGLTQTSDIPEQLLPGRITQTDGEAVPSEELILRTAPAQEPLAALSIILKNGNL